MQKIIKLALLASVSGFALSNGPAMAASFVNGNFETGNFNGWTVGGGFRGNEYNPLDPDHYLPGGVYYNSSIASSHSQVVNKSYVDPNVGAVIGDVVYNGNYSARIEDTTYGGYASVLQQSVTNYQDNSIFFAYKAVLLGAHGPSDAATLQVVLRDVTTGTELYNKSYNAADSGNGVDAQFSVYGDNYYTPNWQIVQLDTSGEIGHTLLLQVLAADCQPTGHWGYAYLDGFGSVTPPVIIPSNVPLPASLPMFGLGVLALGATAGVMRARKAKAAA
jgi:hypothetical protein